MTNEMQLEKLKKKNVINFEVSDVYVEQSMRRTKDMLVQH